MEKEHPTLRVFAWNPNGIRALLKNAPHDIERLVRVHEPDVLFFPETKGNSKVQFEVQTVLTNLIERASGVKGWKWKWTYCAERPGRHGNAVVVRPGITIDRILTGLKEDGSLHESEGRVLALRVTGDFGAAWCVGLYVPNASQKLVRLDHTLRWLIELRKFVDELRAREREAPVPLLIVGDINVAPDVRDICNPTANTKVAGFTAEERKRFAWFVGDAETAFVSYQSGDAISLPSEERRGPGFVDTWREQHPMEMKTAKHEGVYTFWNAKSRARDRNAGWRIDLCLLDRPSFEAGWLQDSLILPDYMGSDHCPVGVVIRKP
jgi:exodeoxyribonuclease-3